MKERILFECVGQAGGNIGQLLAGKGFICHFTNASNEDLNTLIVNEGYKYHIPNAKGCNKDRQKAMHLAKEHYQHIINAIDLGFPRQDIVFFIFSLGGGTGSGMSPLLIDYLSKKNPNKKYGAIVILPRDNESIKVKINAIEAYQQLSKIDRLKSVFVLDNNKQEDKFLINCEFAEMFDDLVNITKEDHRGIIDNAELELLLTQKGNTVMGDFDEVKDMKESHIFAHYKRGCQYIGMSICEDIALEGFDNLFGIPIDKFIGYNDEKNFMIASGMPFTNKRIEELYRSVKDKQNLRSIVNDEVEIDTPILEVKKEKNDLTKLNFDDVFGIFLGGCKNEG